MAEQPARRNMCTMHMERYGMLILLFVLWIILNGRVTVELILFGIPIAGAVYIFLCRVLKYSPKTDLFLLKNLPCLMLYALNLIWEIIKAAFAVMSVAVSRSKRPDPVIVEFYSGLSGRFRNVLLANSITLTPGTYTVFQEEDHFVVHCLRREYAEGLADSSFIRLLGRLK